MGQNGLGTGFVCHINSNSTNTIRMSNQDKNNINDVAVLTYKGYTQVAISLELRLPLETVRGIQKYLSDGGEFATVKSNMFTIHKIKQLENELFDLIEKWQSKGSKCLVTLNKINSLKIQYSTALV